MNDQDRKDITELKSDTKNTAKAVETIITNHLPHISENTGKIKVLVPLVIMCLAGVGGLYGLIIWVIYIVRGG